MPPPLHPRLRGSLLLVLLLLAGGACKEILSLIRFQVSDSSTFTIPAVALVGTQLPLPGVPVTSSSVATYKANNTQAQYVQNVTLDQLQLTIIDPAGQNFDALKNVKIDIATDANGANRVPLAALASIPPGQTSIQLTPAPDTKLDIYLQNGSYTLFATAELAQPVLQKTTLRADARFNVSASN